MNRTVQVYPLTRAVTHDIRNPSEVWTGVQVPYKAVYRTNTHSRTMEKHFTARDDDAAIAKAKALTPPSKPKDLVYMILTHVYRLDTPTEGETP